MWATMTRAAGKCPMSICPSAFTDMAGTSNCNAWQCCASSVCACRGCLPAMKVRRTARAAIRVMSGLLRTTAAGAGSSMQMNPNDLSDIVKEHIRDAINFEKWEHDAMIEKAKFDSLDDVVKSLQRAQAERRA
jgi:hypothetical protein